MNKMQKGMFTFPAASFLFLVCGDSRAASCREAARSGRGRSLLNWQACLCNSICAQSMGYQKQAKYM
ncbi:MAG: hypothetical protein IJ471_07750 [Eubacterium sp.]|nr:hypothetical protein [Eubacterium sp.]